MRAGRTLTSQHTDALNRQRRIMALYDAIGRADGPWTTMDLATWFAHALSFADAPESMVDSVCWDCGYGNWAPYPSDVLPPHPHPTFTRWREQGVDFLQLLVEQTRKRSLECFWSHRIAEVDIRADGGLEMEQLNVIKAAHPDWLVKTWWWQGLWNLAVPEVREFKVRIIRELAERYDFDGFLIDFARHAPFLPVGRQWELRENVTDLMRQLRKMLDEVALTRGRPILLASRVSQNLDACHRDGLDVENWARRGHVDFFVLGSRSMEAGLQEFREAMGSAVKLYPCFDFHHSSDAYEGPSAEVLRGVASNWRHQGADGAVIFNIWPFPPAEGESKDASKPSAWEAQRLDSFEFGDRQRMRGLAKSFPVERRGGYPWTEGACNQNDHAQLPVLLAYDGRPAELALYCGEDREELDSRTGGARLHLVLSKGYYGCQPMQQDRPVPEDRLETRLNGAILDKGVYDFAWRDPQILFPEPQGPAGSLCSQPVNPEQRLLRIAYPVDLRRVKPGLNTVSVSVVRQAPHILRQFRIEKIELFLA